MIILLKKIIMLIFFYVILLCKFLILNDFIYVDKKMQLYEFYFYLYIINILIYVFYEIICYGIVDRYVLIKLFV